MTDLACRIVPHGNYLRDVPAGELLQVGERGRREAYGIDRDRAVRLESHIEKGHFLYRSTCKHRSTIGKWVVGQCKPASARLELCKIQFESRGECGRFIWDRFRRLSPWQAAA